MKLQLKYNLVLLFLLVCVLLATYGGYMFITALLSVYKTDVSNCEQTSYETLTGVDVYYCDE